MADTTPEELLLQLYDGKGGRFLTQLSGMSEAERQLVCQKLDTILQYGTAEQQSLYLDAVQTMAWCSHSFDGAQREAYDYFLEHSARSSQAAYRAQAVMDALTGGGAVQMRLEPADGVRGGDYTVGVSDGSGAVRAQGFSGSFYWALRKAAWYEGVYDSAPGARAYWQAVADRINALCDSGFLASQGGRRTGTAPPIRAEYVGPVLAEGFKSLGYSLTFRGCEPYDAQNMSLLLPEDQALWEGYLGERANAAAQAGTALPYYSPLQKAVYLFLELVRAVYAALVPLLFAAALLVWVRQGMALLRQRRQKALPQGRALLWALLGGLLGMALLRCFMIAFMEVASFNIGTYAMYLSTVHPLLLLFSAAAVLTAWRKNQ